MTPGQLTQKLQEASALIQESQESAAVELLEKIVLRVSDDDRLFKLIGVAHARKGDMQACLDAFEMCVQLNPRDAGNWSNLANALMRVQQYENAARAFERWLSLEPDNSSARYDLAVACLNNGDGGQASQHLQALLATHPDHVAALSLLGQLRQADGDTEAARRCFDRALEIDPDSSAALFGKSLILNDEKRHEVAVGLSRRLVRLNPKSAAMYRHLGSGLAAMGEADEAIESFSAALALEPLNLSLHRQLNEFMWVEDHPGFLQSYHKSLDAHPDAHGLRRELTFKLLQSGRKEEALEQAGQLIAQEPGNGKNYLLQGGVLRRLRFFEAAITAHRNALDLDPASRDCQQELATSFLSNAEPVPALELLEKLHQSDPLHQGYIALMATAYRLQGSDRYRELCDYDRLVLCETIGPPGGYESIIEFNSDLAQYLEALHRGRQHPLDQSLVGGTQTIDDLFRDDHELIRLLKDSLDELTTSFLEQLPRESSHPTLQRLGSSFHCTGAWSVRLVSGGFHVNHYHDLGWYSGPYYVSLPPVIDDAGEKQGWLKLGEPGFECVVPLEADRVIRPEPGMMVRFPSYMWHGTVPFQSDVPRLVVSLDLEPA